MSDAFKPNLSPSNRAIVGALLAAATVVAVHARASMTPESPATPSSATAESETPGQRAFRQRMTSNIREQIAHRMGLPVGEFHVEIENLRFQPAIDPAEVSSVQVLGLGSLSAGRLEGLFAFPVVVQKRASGDAQEQEIQATGVLKVTGPVYTARGGLQAGHIVTKEDLLVTRLPWRSLPNGAFGMSEQKLIGLRVKALIGSGSPFIASLLDEPLAVKSGEMIELTLVSGPGVIIRSRAVARQEGKIGDLIRIEQPETKKLLFGQVTGQKTVEVRL